MGMPLPRLAAPNANLHAQTGLQGGAGAHCEHVSSGAAVDDYAANKKPAPRRGFFKDCWGAGWLSGKKWPFLAIPPLRTVRASFTAYGSSLCKPSLNRENRCNTV